MIRIDKQAEDPDISVYKKKRWKGPDGTKMTLAERDRVRAINYYGDPAKFRDNRKITKEKAIKFEAYAHTETKDLLKSIFRGKCAYCESEILHIEPGDVEHFRPKAEVLTDNSDTLVPGYYWLGADWQNLLLSCINCNRPNKQQINGQGALVTMGKANKFPLSDESKRLRKHTHSLATEENYVSIINPCVEDPEQHLTFEDNGQVIPKDTKGEKSIEVYGLYRADLVNVRRNTNQELENTFWFLVEELVDLDQKRAHGMPTDSSMRKIERSIVILKKAFSEEAEFLAMKRQKLRRFIDENDQANTKLLDFGIDLNDLL